MPIIVQTSSYDVNYIATSGYTLSISTLNNAANYLLYGTKTLTSNMVINADVSVQAPVNGMTYEFEYTAHVTLNGHTLTIFGYSLTAEQALTYGKIVSVYDSIASIWRTSYYPSFTETTGFITSNQIAVGAGLIGEKVLLTFPINFDNGSLDVQTIPQGKFTIDALNFLVTTTLAASDNATIQPALFQSGVWVNVTSGLLTIPASTSAGTYNNAVPTALNITDSNVIRFLCQKTTVGGAGILQVYLTRIP